MFWPGQKCPAPNWCAARRNLVTHLSFRYNCLSMTYIDLQRRLHDHPFLPFRIRMVNSTIYDIHQPWMLTIGESSAVIVTQMRKDEKGYELAMDWKTVSITHMMELSDISPPKSATRKRAS